MDVLDNYLDEVVVKRRVPSGRRKTIVYRPYCHAVITTGAGVRVAVTGRVDVKTQSGVELRARGKSAAKQDGAEGKAGDDEGRREYRE